MCVSFRTRTISLWGIFKREKLFFLQIVPSHICVNHQSTLEVFYLQRPTESSREFGRFFHGNIRILKRLAGSFVTGKQMNKQRICILSVFRKYNWSCPNKVRLFTIGQMDSCTSWVENTTLGLIYDFQHLSKRVFHCWNIQGQIRAYPYTVCPVLSVYNTRHQIIFFQACISEISMWPPSSDYWQIIDRRLP